MIKTSDGHEERRVSQSPAARPGDRRRPQAGLPGPCPCPAAGAGPPKTSTLDSDQRNRHWASSPWAAATRGRGARRTDQDTSTAARFAPCSQISLTRAFPAPWLRSAGPGFSSPEGLNSCRSVALRNWTGCQPRLRTVRTPASGRARGARCCGRRVAARRWRVACVAGLGTLPCPALRLLACPSSRAYDRSPRMRASPRTEQPAPASALSARLARDTISSGQEVRLRKEACTCV